MTLNSCFKKCLFSLTLASTTNLTLAQSTPEIKWSAGGHTGFVANLQPGGDKFGFDTAYVYLGVSAKFNDYWSLNTRLDNDPIMNPVMENLDDTPVPLSLISTRNSPYVRNFFIQSKDAVAKGFRFRVGRHSTTYTEMIETEMPYRWLAESLNRQTSFVYRTVDGMSFLFDHEVTEVAVQVHNGGEGLSYQAPADDSLGLNAYIGVSPFANDPESKAKNLKIHFTYAHDTDATGGGVLGTSSTANAGYSAWMMGATYRDTPINFSLEYGQSKLGPDGEKLGAYALMSDFIVGQTGSSLFLRILGFNKNYQEAGLSKFVLSIGPTFTFSNSVKTAILYSLAKPGASAAVSAPSAQQIAWTWTAQF